MAVRVASAVLMLASAHAAHGEERRAPLPRRTPPPLVLTATPFDLRLVAREAPVARPMRITLDAATTDLIPGDRPNADLCLTSQQDRPREPGAPMKARMSMRLDTRDAGRPDFALGGLGAALMRVGGAILDAD